MKKIVLFLSVGILFVLVTSGVSIAKNGYHDIDATGVKALMDNEEALVVFPLSPMEFDHKHIKGSVNITPAMMESELPADKRKTVVFYCLGVKCVASKRAAERGCDSQIDFVLGNAMAMPFEDETFDFSVCIESSFHYAQLDHFVAEQFRVLKPGGKAVIADITCEDNSKIKFRKGNYFYTASHMLSLLQEHGLEVVSHQRIGPFVFESLYNCICEFNKSHKAKIAKYWQLVMTNYANLSRNGVMGYDVFSVKKAQD